MTDVASALDSGSPGSSQNFHSVILQPLSPRAHSLAILIWLGQEENFTKAPLGGRTVNTWLLGLAPPVMWRFFISEHGSGGSHLGRHWKLGVAICSLITLPLAMGTDHSLRKGEEN